MRHDLFLNPFEDLTQVQRNELRVEIMVEKLFKMLIERTKVTREPKENSNK